MSNPALIGLITGLIAVAVAMAGVLVWDRKQPEDDAIEDPTEAARWHQELTAVNKDFGLAATRAAAGKWAASATTILGVLSTVAIVAGPSNLVEEVGGTAATVAASLVLVAAGLAAVATLLAGIAEQGTPIKAQLTPGGLRARTRTRAQKARQQIFWSRLLTVLALLIIVAATGVAWLTAITKAEPAKTQPVIILSPIGAACGSVSTAESGELLLTVPGASSTPAPLPENARIKLVDSCPE